MFDKLVFNKIKVRLGGRVRAILSGGAPLSRQVQDFLRVTMCCPVYQGYGLTETCAASFVSADEPVSLVPRPSASPSPSSHSSVCLRS